MMDLIVLAALVGVGLLTLIGMRSATNAIRRLSEDIGGLKCSIQVDIPPSVATPRCDQSAGEDFETAIVASATSLVYGDPDDPIFALHRRDSIPQGDALCLSPQRKEHILTLAQSFAGRLGPELLLSGNTYRLVFSKAVTEGLRSGKYVMEHGFGWARAWAKDMRGTFSEHGNLVMTGLTPLGASVLAWQLMAAVTAQHYLQSINAKLERIEKQLDVLQRWFETEEHGDMHGNYCYLHDIAEVLRSQDFTEEERQAYLVHIEGVERDCEKIQARVLLRLRSLFEFHKKNMNQASSIEEFLNRAREFADQCQHGLKSLAMALELQVLVCDLLVATHSSPTLTSIRLKGIESRYTKLEELAQECIRILRTPIDETTHIFNVGKAKQKYDSEVYVLSLHVSNEKEGLLSGIHQGVEAVRKAVARQTVSWNEPVMLDFTVQDGQVQEVFLVPTERGD